MGVCNKQKNGLGSKNRCWALGLRGWRWGWFGSNPGSGPREPNRFGWAYKQGVRPFLFILNRNFSFFILFENRSSLLSPTPPFLLRWDRRRPVVAARWPATVGGGAAAANTFFSCFFSRFLDALLLLYTLLTSKFLYNKY